MSAHLLVSGTATANSLGTILGSLLHCVLSMENFVQIGEQMHFQPNDPPTAV